MIPSPETSTVATPERSSVAVTSSRMSSLARSSCTTETEPTGGVGEALSVVLKPTAEQWASVRPPPEPDRQEETAR